MFWLIRSFREDNAMTIILKKSGCVKLPYMSCDQTKSPVKKIQTQEAMMVMKMLNNCSIS